VGNRDAATLQRLFERIDKPGCIYFTDNWTSYPEVIPAERHIVGKSETHGVERDNSNTRHRVGRFTRRTKIVSHSEQMIDLSMRILTHFENPCNFEELQRKFVSILG
jgi:insertion element IS1 protein InsB